MKITFPLKSIVSLLVVSCSTIPALSHGALLMDYTFDGSGTTVANGGTLGSAADLATFNATNQPTDLRTADGTGVGGIGKAIKFVNTPNTAGPYGYTSGPVSLNIVSGFTISGWLDMSSWTSASSVFRGRNGNAGMNLLILDNDRLQLEIGSGSASTNVRSDLGAYGGAVDEGWMFFAITWDGSTVTFYRGDDEIGSSLSVVGSIAYSAAVADNTTTAFALGNLRTSNADKDRPLNGLMDDFHIYNNFLDASQVNDVRLSAVPEPGQVSLLILGLTGCMLIARKRRQTA